MDVDQPLSDTYELKDFVVVTKVRTATFRMENLQA